MDSTLQLRSAWDNTMRRMASEVPAAWMERFLRPLRPDRYEGGVVTIITPGRFVMDWVRSRYEEGICTILSDELGTDVFLEFVAETREREAAVAAAEPLSVRPVEDYSFRPNERYSFDGFVEGQSNRLALAGAKAVAANPGGKFNPLFIYGPSGLGKTHLLHSIAREVQKKNPRMQIAYLTAQHFAEEFVTALQSNRIEPFRRKQREVQMWLVDDIQLIAGKEKTQEEIFHTFNYLHSLGKQIVLTSDRPPRDLFLIEDRLRTRFEAGLVADIQMPDTETRCAILLRKAKEDSVELPFDVAMVLAENIPGSIRQLEGALIKLMVQASVANVPVSVSLANALVDQHFRAGAQAKPSFDIILETVSKQYQIPTIDIRGKSRKAPIVHARHVAVFITREVTGDSWKHIGSLFGDRDHTSMMHGYSKIHEMMLRDRDLRTAVKAMIRQLNPGR